MAISAASKHRKCTCDHSIMNHKSDEADGVRCQKCDCSRFVDRGSKSIGKETIRNEL